MRKKIQLLRNENVYTPSEGKTALDNAKTDLSNVVLNDGEIVIGRYQENNENVKTVLGIKHNIEADGQENPVEGMTFFTNSDNFVSKPVVLYQTDGTTGLLGVNPSQLGNDWQLENYDFSPYKYLRCYFKMGNFSTNGVELTPSMVVELPLDIESKSKSAGDSTQEEPKTACDMYIAGGMSPNPSDPSNAFSVLVAVDSTKTKFQVINQMMYDEYQYDNTYGNSETPANNNGRFLYKIEGCYDTLNNSSTSEFVEHDPVFTASPAYGITSTDIDNWNSMVSGGGITGITMNGKSKGTSGVVDLGTVVTEETDPTVPSWAKASTKPTYTASEVGAVPTTRTVNGKELSSDISLTSTDVGAVPRSRTVNGKALTGNITLTAEDVGALPNDTVIPTKVSELTNDSGFTTNTGTITGITMNGASKGTSGVVNLGTVVTTETDPTVPSWAKASTKPTYTASEVGALPDSTVIPTKVSDLTNDSGFTTNTGTITGITMNGSSKGTSGVVDLGTVLTSHQDISGKADKSAAIGSLSLALDSTNYKITLSGTKVDGTSFTVSNVIDLPLESVVVNGSYNNTTKKVVLTLQNGSTIDFSVADLVAGLQSEITSTNKLSADLISDGNTNKVVTASDVTNWNSKTDNVGTITGITMNGSSKGTSGVVNLGTVLTAHQSIKTLNGTALTGSGNITLTGVPSFTSADNGKILGVVNGQLAWVTPTTIYTGTGTPSSSQGNNGDIYLQTS